MCLCINKNFFNIKKLITTKCYHSPIYFKPFSISFFNLLISLKISFSNSLSMLHILSNYSTKNKSFQIFNVDTVNVGVYFLGECQKAKIMLNY